MKTTPNISALQAAETPTAVRRLAHVLVAAFLVMPVLTLFTPWQQNVPGNGRVVAYVPRERQQNIDAPVNGRVVKWLVQEGSRVRQGDILLEIADVDVNLLARVEQQRDAALAKLRAKEEEASAYRLQIANLEATRDLQVTTAQHRLDVARQRNRSAQESLAGAQATLETAEAQRQRLDRLIQDGLVSRRDFEVADRDAQLARRSVNSAQASLVSAVAEQRAAQADVDRIRADAQARLDSATASLNKSLSELEESRASLVRSEVDLARQRSQTIVAPRDGTVLRIWGNSESNLVKQGDSLLILVPDTEAKAVELWLDGNDVPLVTPGRHVRLQFEGWPAIQFAGWPEVAIGTFGGTVSFIDATDDGKGKFRIMVQPDTDDRPWPGERFLRQGVRVKGWVLLNQVSLGYELWRQLNGFPPVFTPDERMQDLARKRLK